MPGGLRSTWLVVVVAGGSLLGCRGLVAAAEKDDAGEPARKAVLVSFDELEKRLKEPKLRLLDCRPRADYDKGHLPGALSIDTKSLESQASRPGGLQDRKFWEDWAATLGLDADTQVLVYDARRQLDAARVWFFLRLIGVSKVGLVDGGFPLWEQQKRPISRDAAIVTARPFGVKFQKDVAASRDDVLASLKDKSSRVVDARSTNEFTGADKKSKRGGHIPTACHLEWTTLVDADGRFFDADLLRSKVSEAGLSPGSAVITHCQGGGRASVNAFALELLGYRARNYYAGWSDWGNADGTPAVEGDESSPK